MQEQELTIVDRFSTVAQARVACDYLRAHGVDALLMEGDRIRFNPLRASERSGVRVMVRSADHQTASELLALVEAEETPNEEASD